MPYPRKKSSQSTTPIYKTPPPKPPPPPPPHPSSPPRRSRKPLFIGGLAIYLLSTYAFYTYTKITQDPASSTPQDTDTSSRYNETARDFDATVSFTEGVCGIDQLRRKMTRMARGHVLEASVGTGRNAGYLDLRRCGSVTFVDQSKEMVAVAREKFTEAHPGGCPVPVRFCAQSILDRLPGEAGGPGEGYDTVLQTMGLCSTPEPVAMLARLGQLARRDGGRVLLLEHGRSYYGVVNWMLDRAAGAHAVRHGCWWNRDIGQIVAQSGLVVEKMERRHLGTTWWVELRPRRKGDEARGKVDVVIEIGDNVGGNGDEVGGKGG